MLAACSATIRGARAAAAASSRSGRRAVDVSGSEWRSGAILRRLRDRLADSPALSARRRSRRSRRRRTARLCARICMASSAPKDRSRSVARTPAWRSTAPGRTTTAGDARAARSASVPCETTPPAARQSRLRRGTWLDSTMSARAGVMARSGADARAQGRRVRGLVACRANLRRAACVTGVPRPARTDGATGRRVPRGARVPAGHAPPRWSRSRRRHATLTLLRRWAATEPGRLSCTRYAAVRERGGRPATRSPDDSGPGTPRYVPLSSRIGSARPKPLPRRRCRRARGS